MVGNALGLFGAGVYLRAITASTGWATGTVSGAVTLFYVVSAVLLIPVGVESPALARVPSSQSADLRGRRASLAWDTFPNRGMSTFYSL